MSDLGYPLALRQRVAAWSDLAQKKAAEFADAHRDLYPRRITNAQLYGLANVIRSVRHFADIQRFMQHQGGKAERAGRLDVRDYWLSLDKVLSDLQTEARYLQQQVGPPPLGTMTKVALDELHRQLALEFTQHLIAHYLYWTPATSRGDRQGR